MLKERRPVTGAIDPRCMYTTEGVWSAAALSRRTLSQARQTGQLRAYRAGCRDYYLGSDLINFITGMHDGRDRTQAEGGLREGAGLDGTRVVRPA